MVMESQIMKVIVNVSSDLSGGGTPKLIRIGGKCENSWIDHFCSYEQWLVTVC